MADDLLASLQATLSEVPGLNVLTGFQQSLPGEEAVMAEARLQVAGKPLRLLVQTRRSSHARDLRDAAQRLEPLRDVDAEVPVVPLLAAPRISQSGREFLRSRGIGYCDLGKSFSLQLPWAVYFIDRPPPPGGPRKRREVFRGRTAQVLHALLLEPERAWRLNELAARAGTSSYIALQACTYLEEQFWMERQGKGPHSIRLLREPGALLDAWAQAHSLAQYEAHQYYRWAQSGAELRQALGAALETAGVEYALTLAAAAELMAPFATPSERLAVIVPEATDLMALAEAAALRPVEDGENLLFLRSREASPLLFRQKIAEVWAVSAVQLYLDLCAWPQRGREQAQHLRRERLPY